MTTTAAPIPWSGFTNSLTDVAAAIILVFKCLSYSTSYMTSSFTSPVTKISIRRSAFAPFAVIKLSAPASGISDDSITHTWVPLQAAQSVPPLTLLLSICRYQKDFQLTTLRQMPPLQFNVNAPHLRHCLQLLLQLVHPLHRSIFNQPHLSIYRLSHSTFPALPIWQLLSIYSRLLTQYQH